MRKQIDPNSWKLNFLVVFSFVCGLFCLPAAKGGAPDCFAQNENVKNETASPEPSNATAVQVNATAVEAPVGNEASAAVAPAAESAPQASLSDLVTSARKAKDKGDFEKVYALVAEAMERFGDKARAEQKGLKEFPPSEQMGNYEALNNVAQCQFIKAEALKSQGKKDEAISAFKVIVSDFSFAQAWDPRGWYYKLAATAQDGIDLMMGRDLIAEKCGQVQATQIDLYDPGKEEIVNYEKYGEFSAVGTKDYKYIIKDQEGLSEAAGEGIYPNTTSVRWDPLYQEMKKSKRLEGSHWDLVHSVDLQAAFFKWVLAPEPSGIRLFYTGLILEKSGLIKHAIKAYYAVVVHYPNAVAWTYWHTPWYIGPAAITRIKYLCKKYPQVNMKLEGTKIKIENGFDNDISNDVFYVTPGKLVKEGFQETIFDKLGKFIRDRQEQSKVRRRLGQGKVYFQQYENGDWQMMADGKPYVIKGITYAVAKVGQSPDDGTLKNWMDYDYNNNGKCDGPYDSFVDANGNNKQDPDEPNVGDFKLMKRMGVNTIRLYHQPFPVKKELLRDLYKRYGIRVIMGDFLGKYALGSGADWHEGTDYENPTQQKAMFESVRQMVLEHKDEPYLLMWILGNENVYGVACNADKKPEAYFKFVNEVAKLIKSLDPDHPVAVANGDILFLDRFAKYASDVDAFGANLYRGDSGFGNYWESVKDLTDKPAFVTEYGCPAYVYCYTREEAEETQAEYFKSCWGDIMDNSAFVSGAGNAVGGVLFEWLDEWWKAYEPSLHDTKGLWAGPFPDGFMHEEWLGVSGQGDGKLSPFLRQLRKSYYSFEKLWKK